MSDKIIECVECGRTFVWSSGEQRYYREHRLDPPKRCEACRSQRKSERNSGMRGLMAPSIQPSVLPTYRKRQLSWWRDPVYRHGLVTFGLAIASAAGIWWYGYPLDVVQSWLIAITLVTLLTYGYDKAIAGSKRTRVPEKVLLALAFTGGTIGALVGMPLFHHKTAKGRFRSKFWLVVVAQIVLLVVYYALVKPQVAGN
jgi:uncharacterized membrane protein YsdA (DUF1294 family)